MFARHRVAALRPLLCACCAFGCGTPASPPVTGAAGVPSSVTAAPPPTVSAEVREQRSALLDELYAALRERYVDLALAKQMVAALQQRWQRGGYDALSDAEAFTAAVTADLQAAGSDPHVTLAPPREADAPRERRPDRRSGFGKSERLAGNVAVLPIYGFPPLNGEPQQQALADALSSVADAAALIIDLRENNGGRAPTMAVVASYFFEGPPLLLLRVARRYDGASYELWTQTELRGTPYGARKPLFLLTSGRTFSGGEGLAHALQERSRAVVVGEVTRGGDSLVERRELTGGYALTLSVAIGISGATQQSRKGGVVPDVAVPAARALDEAHRRALEVLAQPGSSSG